MSIRDEKSGNYVIDPLTRIEGHLRVELDISGGVVNDAWVSGTLYRGFETMIKGRTPIDAAYMVQRICGVCPVPNTHVSCYASEDATGVTLPNGARLVRNILELVQFLQSHIIWFYTLAAVDYVDISRVLEANVADTYALAQQAGTSVADFGAVQAQVKKLIDGGDLSIFTNGWFGHPAFSQTMPPELHLIGVAHYLEALQIQAEAARIMAVVGGKFPHPMSSVPGGTTWMPTEEKLDDLLFRLYKIQKFVNNTLIPDTLAIAPHYLDALNYGGGCKKFLSWGVFDSDSLDPADRYLARGFVDATGAAPVASAIDDSDIHEYVTSTWDNANPELTRWDSETKPDFTEYDVQKKYSWCKSPRINGEVAEVGPLARMLASYLNPDERYNRVRELVDTGLGALGAAGNPGALLSLLGRVAARNLENPYLIELAIAQTQELIAYVKEGGSSFFQPAQRPTGNGAGLWEAPRGAITHWDRVKGGKIDNYVIIIPSTWNLGPRDEEGRLGPVEQALVGTPILDPERPLEAARIVRSFDPCVGCSIHAVERKTGKTGTVYARQGGAF
ncbi:MAG: nickel-dependent hydrogenase large subunit [Actinomycetes bacterium]|jgi:hydrogenase large subunit|nr:nickel-dependent hydrogenase large subunit [Actinomycetes bacterium]